MNNKFLRCSLVGALLVALAVPLVGQMKPPHPMPMDKGPATTLPADTVVMTVGPEKITLKDFNEFLAALPHEVQMQIQMTPGGKRMLAEQMTTFKLLAAEAKKRGMEDSPSVKFQMAIAKEQILASALQKEMGNMTDDDLKKYFEEHKADFDQVKARHILVRGAGSPVPLAPGAKETTDEAAKAKADDIKKRLDKGEDFAKVAKAESDDKGSGAQGGDLPPFGRKGEMVEPFAAAAFGLKLNEISQPVKSQFGYHIIQVTERKNATYEDTKFRLKNDVARQKQDDLINQLKKDNKTELNDAFFGAAGQHPAMPME